MTKGLLMGDPVLSLGSIQRKRLRSIQEAARHSVGCEVGDSVAFEAHMLVTNLARVREAIKETDAQITRICRRLPGYENILSIPGFGPFVASAVLAAIGDPYRFSSAKQVLKMAGLDLSASRSGKNSANVSTRISKKGKAGLRYALYQSALIATSRNKNFVEYFTRLIKGREREQGIKTKMRVKVAAKILVVAWTLLKNGEMFQPEHLLK